MSNYVCRWWLSRRLVFLSNSVPRFTAKISSQQKQPKINFHLIVNCQSNLNTIKHVRIEIWKRQKVGASMRSRVSAFFEGARRDWAWAARARHAPVGASFTNRVAGTGGAGAWPIGSFMRLPSRCGDLRPDDLARRAPLRNHTRERVSDHYKHVIVMWRKPCHLLV